MSLSELLPHLKSLWTLWFFLVFAGVIAWTLWPGRRQTLEAHGHLPLEEDLPVQGERDGR
jgi:cbb3-type cytochrome oxidase subunit 3